MQQGDVKLVNTVDGGDISVVGGVTEMSSGFETASYLSMFGGNKEDDGSDGNPETWWGNIDETEPAKQYRSETQFILDSLPASSGNLKRVEAAAIRDHQWFLDLQIASSVTVEATIPTRNKIKLTVNINAEGEETSFSFTENWKAAE